MHSIFRAELRPACPPATELCQRFQGIRRCDLKGLRRAHGHELPRREFHWRFIGLIQFFEILEAGIGDLPRFSIALRQPLLHDGIRRPSLHKTKSNPFPLSRV